MAACRDTLEFQGTPATTGCQDGTGETEGKGTRETQVSWVLVVPLAMMARREIKETQALQALLVSKGGEERRPREGPLENWAPRGFLGQWAIQDKKGSMGFQGHRGLREKWAPGDRRGCREWSAPKERLGTPGLLGLLA